MTVARNASGRVAEPRPRMVRLMTYWMILTIGPLLLGASLSLSSYGFVSAALQQGERAIGLTQLLPFLLAAGAFTLLYAAVPARAVAFHRSEEHTSELQSLMRISSAVFCMKKKKTPPNTHN